MALADAAPALNLLVGARSKEVLARVLQDAYDGRLQGLTRDRRRRLCEELTLPDDAAACALVDALRALIAFTLREGGEGEAWFAAALPEDFPAKLRTRVAKALALALPGWREASVATHVSVPRLLEAECCVVASPAGTASVAGVTLHLRVEGAPTHASAVPPPRDVTVLLDHAALAAAVASADQLRTRLAAVAGQHSQDAAA